MAKSSVMEKVGSWSFIIGFIVAVVLGAVGYMASGLLLILGTIVGLLNISDREIVPFLVACIALIITGSVAQIIPFMTVGRILANVVIFVVPAAIIASLKAIIALASSR